MPPLAREAIRELEQLRQSRVIVYVAEDQPPFPKGLEDEDVRAMYACLRQLGPTDRLALVLHTYGGRVNVSRRLYHLLRSYAPQIDVLVPYKARSAGTLLCLGARELVLTPLAELGPIDPYIHAAGETAGMPPVISAEDVRAFRALAEQWFGLDAPEQRLEVFKLLAGRIFPTTLSAFFRADQQVRAIAAELLSYQLPEQAPETRARIIDQLVSGYHAHDYTIARAEAAALGLRVSPARPAEEALLERIWETCRQHLDSSGTADDPPERIDGLLLTAELTARHVAQTTLYLPPRGAAQSDRQPAITTQIIHGRWQIG